MKKKIKDRIEKSTSKENIEKIKHIIFENNPNLEFTQNSSGVLLFFHKLSQETYEKIDNLLKKYEHEKIKKIKLLSDENSPKMQITAEQVSNIKDSTQSIRLSSLEKNIIKKKDYYEKLKEENECDSDIIYRSEDDPFDSSDLFLNKNSDKKEDKKKSNKQPKKK